MAGRPKGIPKTGGRKAGTPNKLNATARALMEQFGFDPLKGMISIAIDADQEPAIRARMYAELAQYAYPKLRAMELTGAAGGPIAVDVTSEKESLAARIAGVAARLGAGTDSPAAE